MAEVFAWSEGSAYFFTGAGGQSALATFARNIGLTLNREWNKYRPPRQTNYIKKVVSEQATLTCGQLYSQFDLIQMFESATGGIHCHIEHMVTGGVVQTGGFYLYSGELNSLAHNGSDGNLLNLTLQGSFNVWSAH